MKEASFSILPVFVLLCAYQCQGQDIATDTVSLDRGGTVVYRLGQQRGNIIGEICSGATQSPAEIVWVKVTTGVVISRKSGTIENFRWSTLGLLAAGDAGTYRCELRNRNTNTVLATAPGFVTVVIAAPPQIQSFASSFNSPNRDPIARVCVITGYQVLGAWTGPSRADYNVTDQRVSPDSVSSVLNVRGIWNRDAGQYTCTAFSTASCTVPSAFTKTEECFSQNASRTVNINIIVNKPNAVRSLQVTVGSANNASLTWSVPPYTNPTGIGQASISNYSVSWSAVDQWYSSVPNKSVVVDATLADMTYTVTSLPDYAQVMFDVSARDETGTLGPSVTTQARTLESVPGRPIISISGTTASSFSVIIAPPALADRNGILRHYNVSYSSDCSQCPGCCTRLGCQQQATALLTISSPPTPMSFTRSSLCNSIQYTLHASACTAVGCGAVASSQILTSDIVPSPPENLRADVINSTSMKLSWQEPALTTFGPYLRWNVTVFAMKSDYQDGSCQLRKSTIHDANSTISPSRVNTFIVSHLCASTWYTFTVYGSNSAGISLGRSASAYTLDGTPSAPSVIIEAADVTSLVVVWNLPVLGRAGQLTSFSMRYTADCPAMHCCCSGQCSRNKTILINDTDLNQRTSYMRVIDGLCPSTTYTVIVSAMNREQTSPISGSASGVRCRKASRCRVIELHCV